MIKFNPDIHKRKSLRLKNYDYSQNGLYFITIAVQNKLCLFGTIKNGENLLNESGKMIEEEWKHLEKKYKNITLHHFMVMPNHFHGIIEIKNDVNLGTHYNNNQNINVGAIPCGCPEKGNLTLGDIIGAFKSITTNTYIKNVEENNWIEFNKKLWQKNYYEHIIRDETGYQKISEYIANNPIKWDEDTFYYTEIF